MWWASVQIKGNPHALSAKKLFLALSRIEHGVTKTSGCNFSWRNCSTWEITYICIKTNTFPALSEAEILSTTVIEWCGVNIMYSDTDTDMHCCYKCRWKAYCIFKGTWMYTVSNLFHKPSQSWVLVVHWCTSTLKFESGLAGFQQRSPIWHHTHQRDLRCCQFYLCDAAIVKQRY